jgi:hypothetical protein
MVIRLQLCYSKVAQIVSGSQYTKYDVLLAVQLVWNASSCSALLRLKPAVRHRAHYKLCFIAAYLINTTLCSSTNPRFETCIHIYITLLLCAGALVHSERAAAAEPVRVWQTAACAQNSCC